MKARCLVSVTWNLSLAGAPSSSNWQPEDTVNAEHITDVEVSAVGPATVLWVKATPDKEKDGMISQIFLSTAERTVQLTRGKNSCTQPRFSPDGQRIAFLSDRPLPKEPKSEATDDDPKVQIWMIEQGEPYPVTAFHRPVRQFAWRDTNHIVFVAAEPPTERELKLKEKKDKSRVIEDEANEAPVRLFDLEISSRQITRLTSNTDRISALFVSPDRVHAVTFHEAIQSRWRKPSSREFDM